MEIKKISSNDSENLVKLIYKCTDELVSTNSNNINSKGNKNVTFKLQSDTKSQRANHKNNLRLLYEKHVKFGEKDRNARKKSKEPGVINEYPASAIPNNIGDKSIEKLTDFVNGTKTTCSDIHIKSEKKIKIFNGNKKQENMKDTDIMIQNGTANIIITKPNPVNVNSLSKQKIINMNLKIPEHNKHINDNGNAPVYDIDRMNYGDNFVDYSENDEDFYQVVRHKSRNKTKILKQENNHVVCKRLQGNNDHINSKPKDETHNKLFQKFYYNNHLSNYQTININDKENLNWFIYHLWIEFQKNHEKYLDERNN